ncbi:hypothetical protein K4F52_000154 [Lecanicillium sp. MT-2017a]|nr:hypothetical protein K4F52_000154 [Lecanicillium sp. MT-2017a]
MPQPPETTPVPPNVFEQPTTPAKLHQTAHPQDKSQQPQSSPHASTCAEASSPSSSSRPFPLPKLRLEIRNLTHPAAHRALTALNLSECVATATQDVLRTLYASPADRTTTPPPTRSVTLVLRDMGGVAYTTGTELDDDHKEVHFSLPYIDGVRPPERLAAEIRGVVTHELVHCFQHNAFGTCPGGLIEGVADWVRLQCGHVPPHWKREAKGKWDDGYQSTGYFLEYLEQRFGQGTVRRLNEKLRIQKYREDEFWVELLGRPVDELFEEYRQSLQEEK